MDKERRLYNAIVLPDEWPPRDRDPDSLEPPRIPYLEAPPDPIPIDVGRQLFVDDFLIESTDLARVFHQAEKHPVNPVLSPETPLELNGGDCPVASPFNDGVWYDPTDGLYKIWYHAGWFDGTAYATSEDGIRWVRPVLDVASETNRVLPFRPGFRRDGCCVWLDHDASDAGERFKMFQFARTADGQAGEVYRSADGIHWGKPERTGPCGDNTTMFYNPFRKQWVFSIRTHRQGMRTRHYREDADFLETARWAEDKPVFWARSDRFDSVDPAIGDPPQLYDVNAVGYESLMLGTFAIFQGPSNAECARIGVPKTNELILGFSRDGFHFDRPDRRPFICASRRPKTWDRGYIHAAGGVCLIVKDRLHFYFGAWSGESPNLKGDMLGAQSHARVMYAGGTTGLATLRRDGFASMDGDPRGGELVTRPVTFSGKHLFVNVDSPQGELRTEVLDEAECAIPPFSLAACDPVSVDSTRHRVTWSGGGDLSGLAGRRVRFRFKLTNGRLYAFWVSPDASGASHGYVAAGGPGFTGGTDTVGGSGGGSAED